MGLPRILFTVFTWFFFAGLALRCILSGSIGILNVATGRSVTFRQLAELVASQFDQPIEIVETPRAMPIMHRHYDITNLVKTLPDFRFTSLEDGIARVHREQMAVGDRR